MKYPTTRPTIQNYTVDYQPGIVCNLQLNQPHTPLSSGLPYANLFQITLTIPYLPKLT